MRHRRSSDRRLARGAYLEVCESRAMVSDVFSPIFAVLLGPLKDRPSVVASASAAPTEGRSAGPSIVSEAGAVSALKASSGKASRPRQPDWYEPSHPAAVATAGGFGGRDALPGGDASPISKKSATLLQSVSDLPPLDDANAVPIWGGRSDASVSRPLGAGTGRGGAPGGVVPPGRTGQPSIRAAGTVQGPSADGLTSIPPVDLATGRRTGADQPPPPIAPAPAADQPSDAHAAAGGMQSALAGAPQTDFFGHVDVAIAAIASSTGSFTLTSGSLSVSTIPAGAKVEQATLYASNYLASASPTLTFAGVSQGSADVAKSEGTFYSYGWDVTSEVSGSGTYATTTTNLSYCYGLALVVVYSDINLPMSRVTINNDPLDLNTGHSTRNPKTGSETFRSLAGTGKLWIFTVADGDPAHSNEVISLNGQSIGGPIDGNLGGRASLISRTGIAFANGSNTLTVFTPQDWFAWQLTVKVLPNYVDLDVRDSSQGYAPWLTESQEDSEAGALLWGSGRNSSILVLLSRYIRS